MLAKANAEAKISKPVQSVWAVLGDFGNLDWAIGNGLESYEIEGEGIGMCRIPKLPNGNVLRERLIYHSPDAMTIEYQIIGGNFLESTDYKARVWIEEAPDGCVVRWSCQAKFLDTEFETGQAALEAMASGMAAIFALQFEG